MKRAFRFTVFVLLVGGWALAGAALHVVRTPGQVVVMPKNRLTFHDTFVDTRKWTLADVSIHAAVSTRLVQIGRGNLLAGVADPAKGDPQVQLAAAIAHPQDAPPSTQPAVFDRAKAGVVTAAHRVKSIFD